MCDPAVLRVGDYLVCDLRLLRVEIVEIVANSGLAGTLRLVTGEDARTFETALIGAEAMSRCRVIEPAAG